MPETESASPVPEGRVSTGVRELDTILNGGLLGRRPYLIVGPAGTGKTTLALQFLCEGVRQGERCLLVTLEEPPNEVRVNHPGLVPEIDRVDVFDAIPDVMRYERAPFKDIAAVRHSAPFSEVPHAIRKSPELSSVEVTFTALEQTLRMEVARHNYQRIVIDSLTALQYFCMKGVDEITGAQTFLRFLSDLRITTILTVEAPLEDVETPERMLARGEIRLFRWELEGKTVRAIGVEKFRGSPHDVRLHPYRISSHGLDINLGVTISRDTREIVAPLTPTGPEPLPAAPVGPSGSARTAIEELADDLRDLIAVGMDLATLRPIAEEAGRALRQDDPLEIERSFVRARGMAIDLVTQFQRENPALDDLPSPTVRDAARRLLARASDTRGGVPPGGGLASGEVRREVERLLTSISLAFAPKASSTEPPAPPAQAVLARPAGSEGEAATAEGGPTAPAGPSDPVAAPAGAAATPGAPRKVPLAPTNALTEGLGVRAHPPLPETAPPAEPIRIIDLSRPPDDAAASAEPAIAPPPTDASKSGEAPRAAGKRRVPRRRRAGPAPASAAPREESAPATAVATEEKPPAASASEKES